MLILLRIVLGLGLAYVVHLAHENARAAGAAGLFDSLFYLGLVFVLAIANAVVWAPYVGGMVANAMSGEMSGSDSLPKKRRLPRGVSFALGGLAVLGLAALSFWIWQNRAMFDPLADLVRAWRMGHAPWSAPERELYVEKVLDGENLQARDPAGQLFTIRLAGLEAPNRGSYRPEVRAQAKEGQEFLASAVLSNHVNVEVTLTNAARVILGFVRVGETNVNAAYVAAGLAEFRPDALGNASLKSRWALLQAHRRVEMKALKDQPK